MNNSSSGSGIKIYFASCDFNRVEEYETKFPNDELNILFSYGICDDDYLNMNDKKRSIMNSLICDSGTFSLNNNKNKNKNPNNISLEGYIEFAKSLSKYVDFFLNYDENFTLDGFNDNYKNMKRLEENGITVVPVVHDYKSENVDEIGIYLKEQYPIIALGASPHKTAKKDMLKNISHAANRIVDGGAKVHLLGVTDIEILSSVPFYSCDSTSWARNQENGKIPYWNPKYNTTEDIYMLDTVCSEFKHKGKYNIHNNKDFREFLDSVNITKTDIMSVGRTNRRKILSMKYFVTMQDIIRKEHKQRGFKID